MCLYLMITKPNKVLILSTEADESTNDVIDWLLFKNIEVIRLNDTDSVCLNQKISVDRNGQIKTCPSMSVS